MPSDVQLSILVYLYHVDWVWNFQPSMQDMSKRNSLSLIRSLHRPCVAGKFRPQRIGFLPQQFSTFRELCEQADRSLFSSIIANSAHVLASLLPPIHHTGYDLRKRSHDHIIPRADTFLRKQFILRMLYDY